MGRERGRSILSAVSKNLPLQLIYERGAYSSPLGYDIALREGERANRKGGLVTMEQCTSEKPPLRRVDLERLYDQDFSMICELLNLPVHS